MILFLMCLKSPDNRQLTVNVVTSHKALLAMNVNNLQFAYQKQHENN